MSRLEQLTALMDIIETKFYVDLLDLRLMAKATEKWNDKREVRVTDLTLLRDLASSATLHYRVTKSLVDDGFFVLRSNPQDMREKLVEPGPEYVRMIKFLENME